MNKISTIKKKYLKEEFIKQIDDSYTLNLSMVLLEEFEELQQENNQLKDRVNKAVEYCKNDDNFRLSDLYSQSIADEIQKDLLDLLKGDKE